MFLLLVQSSLCNTVFPHFNNIFSAILGQKLSYNKTLKAASMLKMQDEEIKKSNPNYSGSTLV